MGAHLSLLPKGFKGQPYRSTDGTIFACLEGKGQTTIDGEVFEWGPRDVFVIPSWKQYSHKADDQSVLFSISDRPMQESLGIWREVNCLAGALRISRKETARRRRAVLLLGVSLRAYSG